MPRNAQTASAPAGALLSGAVLAASAGAALLATRGISRSMSRKVVVITGGSRGLGLALAEEFGRHGATLILAARKEEELQRAQRHLLVEGFVKKPSHLQTIACDLTHAEEAQKLIRKALDRFGRIDVLVNNAGVIHVGPIEEQSLQMYRDAMDSNFFSLLYTTYAVLPHMLKQRTGSIVNIASIGGKIPVPHLAPYSASKFAAVGFSETLHAELKPKGIRVTTVNPGLMRTGSYPNAVITGQKEKEYDWFSLSASIPGLAHSATYAARKIYRAVLQGRTELEIGLDAFLAARIHGLSPSLTQLLGGFAESVILPEAGGNSTPAQGKDLPALKSKAWQRWSRNLTRRFNEPTAE